MTIDPVPELFAEQGAAVTVGTFDGVHPGHRAVLEEVARRGNERGLRKGVVTFDPHPLQVVRPDDAPRILTTVDERTELLASLDLDFVFVVHFTNAVSRYSPAQFVTEVLVRRLNTNHLVVGYDHGLGRGRSGGAAELTRLGREHGFEVSVVGEVGGGVVSSTRIRQLISSGEIEAAAERLGRTYSFRGVVTRGLGRGRKLGFPTANLAVVPEKLLPAEGIYAVRTSVRGSPGKGLLHLGPRPVFPGSPPSVEVWILDFDEDIYDEVVIVDVLHRIRGVLAFETPEALSKKVREDEARARAYFEDLAIPR